MTGTFIKELMKKAFKPQKTTGTEVVNPFKANPQTKDSKQIIKLKKIPGQTKNKFKGVTEGIESSSRDLRRLNQKLKGEPVTESGVSKGKNLVKKADGGRIGRKFGTPNPRKTNVQKIKETFGPKKKLSPKQMKIAKLAGNPNKIDGADFKKLRGKA